jgi:hypothetical protein
LQPSGEVPTMARPMFTSLLTCSDEDCLELATFAGSLEAADDVLCEGCGCLMQVVAVAGGHETAEVIEFSTAAAHRRRQPALRAAA